MEDINTIEAQEALHLTFELVVSSQSYQALLILCGADYFFDYYDTLVDKQHFQVANYEEILQSPLSNYSGSSANYLESIVAVE